MSGDEGFWIIVLVTGATLWAILIGYHFGRKWQAEDWAERPRMEGYAVVTGVVPLNESNLAHMNLSYGPTPFTEHGGMRRLPVHAMVKVTLERMP